MQNNIQSSGLIDIIFFIFAQLFVLKLHYKAPFYFYRYDISEMTAPNKREYKSAFIV